MALPTTISGTQLEFPLHNYYCGPFKSSNDEFYAVLLDGDGGFFPRSEVEVHKATDPTSSFSEQDSANRPSVSAVISMWAVQDGDDLHIATHISGGRVSYSVFHMATDLWDGTLIDLLVEAGGSAPSCSIGVRSDGDVIVLYNGTPDKIMGTNYDRVDYGRKENGTFATVGVAVDNAGETNWKGSVIVPGSSDRMHFFFADITSADGYQRTLLSDNSLETFPSAGDSTLGGLDHPFVHGMSHEVAGVQKIRCPYHDSNGKISYAEFDSADAPGAFSVNVDISDVAVASQPGSGETSPVACSSADNEDEYLLYADSASDDLQMDRNDTTDTEILDAVTIERISCNIYIRDALHLAYLYSDGGTIKYNEEQIGAPGAIRQYLHRYLRGT